MSIIIVLNMLKYSIYAVHVVQKLIVYEYSYTLF